MEGDVDGVNVYTSHPQPRLKLLFLWRTGARRHLYHMSSAPFLSNPLHELKSSYATYLPPRPRPFLLPSVRVRYFTSPLLPRQHQNHFPRPSHSTFNPCNGLSPHSRAPYPTQTPVSPPHPLFLRRLEAPTRGIHHTHTRRHAPLPRHHGRIACPWPAARAPPNHIRRYASHPRGCRRRLLHLPPGRCLRPRPALRPRVRPYSRPRSLAARAMLH